MNVSVIFLFVFLLQFAVAENGYNQQYDISHLNISMTWTPVELPKIQSSELPGKAAEIVVGQAVYVSITVIARRLKSVVKTITTLLMGTVYPTRIYLFISYDPYLIDTGVKKIPPTLVTLAQMYPLSIVYVDNIGPHRKLLPLLWKKWNEDCVIITFDDDLGSKKNNNQLSLILQYYLASNKDSVISPRPRRIGVCSKYPHKALKYGQWPITYAYGSKELLLLPTGNGGILYRPNFFHPIVFDDKLRNITGTADDIMFRLATLARNISVVIGCRFRCPKKIKIFYPLLNLTKVDKRLQLRNETQLYLENEKEFGGDHDPVGPLDTQVTKNHFIDDHFLNFNENNDKTLVTPHRQLKSSSGLKPLRLTTNSKETSLYSFNIRGQNEVQFSKATAYLKALGIFNFAEFARGVLPLERPAHCFKSKSSKVSTTCSMKKCSSHSK